MRIKTARVVASALALAVLMPWSTACGQEGEADDNPTTVKLNAQTGKFFAGIAVGDVQAAYAELLKESQLLKQAEPMNGLIEKTKELKKYGRYRSHELVATKYIGSDLVLLKYLYKCDDFPVVWYFTFYRDFRRSDAARDTNLWVLVAVRFDTDLDLLGL